MNRLSLLGIGIALITCTTKIIGGANQSITAADIDQVEAIALSSCAPFARQRVEGQDWVRSIRFRIKPAGADCLHVEAFRILPNPFDIHFMACKRDGKWQIEPAHLEQLWRHDK